MAAEGEFRAGTFGKKVAQITSTMGEQVQPGI